MRIRLDEVHYEIAHRYEVNTGPMCIFPSGFSFDESICEGFIKRSKENGKSLSKSLC